MMPQIVEKISEDSEVDIEVDNTLPTVVSAAQRNTLLSFRHLLPPCWPVPLEIPTWVGVDILWNPGFTNSWKVHEFRRKSWKCSQIQEILEKSLNFSQTWMSQNKVEMLGTNLFEYNSCFLDNCVCQLTFFKSHRFLPHRANTSWLW